MDRKFATIYEKYTTAHRARAYSEMIKIMVAYKCGAASMNSRIEQHLYMFRSVFSAMTMCTDFTADDAAKVINEFQLVLKELSRNRSTLKYLSALNMLAQSDFLTGNASILASVAITPKISQWMRTVTECLATVSADVTCADDRKIVFSSLTQSALIFYKLECHACDGNDFAETNHYLNVCMNMDLLRSDKYAGDYVQCFTMMTKYVNAYKNDGVNWTRSMDELLSFIAKASKMLRATAAQDIAVSLTELLEISKPKLCSMLNGARMRVLFKVLLKLSDILRHTKYEKSFCLVCKTNVGLHLLDVVAGLAVNVFKHAIETNIILDANVCDMFGKLFAGNLVSLSKLDCALSARLQALNVQHIKQLATLCSTKERAKYAEPMFVHICRSIENIQLTKLKFSAGRTFDTQYVLRSIYDFVRSVENWSAFIHVGFLVAAYQLAEKKPNESYHRVLYEVRQTQIQHKDTIPFETPYDYYETVAAKGDPIFHLKFPDNVSGIDMLLAYLKVNGLYFADGVDELNDKCIAQLIGLANKHKSITCMRFIYLVDRFDWEAVAKQCECHLKALRATANTGDTNRKRAVSLLLGAFDLHTYSVLVTETAKKNQSVSLSNEFNSKERLTVFDVQTLAFERSCAELLLNAKRKIDPFFEFCLDASEADALTYADESRYLLKALTDIARHLQSRGYEREALETFVALYRLAKKMGDQFAMISACSYFAENSLIFREHFGRKFHLAAMLGECYVILVQNLKKIDELSIRKQKELFHCMLNIALHHFADDRIEDGKKVLRFIKEQMSERNLDKSIVEMKYFSVLFTMITKYEQPSQFSAIRFGKYLIHKIRTGLGTLPPEDTVNIPLIMFNTVPAIVTFCMNRYETSSTVCDMLLLTVMKFSVRAGYVRRTLNALILTGMYELSQEKWKMAEERLEFLEHICLIRKKSEAASGDSMLLMPPSETTIDCTDPIRRDASASAQCLSPFKVKSNGVESHTCRYLLTSHMENCSCDMCYTPYNRFTLFQMGSLYTRIMYLNESDARTKLTIQSEIYEYWSKQLKESKLPELDDTFRVGQARLLMWCAHIQWKFGKNLQKTKNLLNESIECLQKVSKYDRAMEHDLLGQVELLNNEKRTQSHCIGSTSKVVMLNRKKGFIDEAVSKLQAAPVVAAKKATLPVPSANIFTVAPKRWQIIHDDDAMNTEVATKKPSKKTTTSRRNRSQKDTVAEEILVVDLTTPPSTADVSVVEASPEQPVKNVLSRSNRIKWTPPNDGAESTRSAMASRKRTDKSEAAETPVTRAPRSRQARK